jgi:hypothetical protein
MRGPNFSKMEEKKHPYGELFLHLYPARDWKYNLARLNEKIDAVNESRSRKSAIKRVSEQEWWTFHALIITATHQASCILKRHMAHLLQVT